MTLWLPHQPLPEGKYLYEVKKQLLWEPTQRLCSVINSPPSAVLSTPGPEQQGLRFRLGPGQPSSGLQSPTPASATEPGRRPLDAGSISLICPQPWRPTMKDEGLEA